MTGNADPSRPVRAPADPASAGGSPVAVAPDALVVDDVTVARGGRDVVHGVSLAVPRGEVTALLGPNGAGKSSLVLAIAGVLPARSGSIAAGGRQLSGRSPDAIRAHGVAVVPEGHRVLGNLSVSDNLRVAASRMTRDEEAAGRERVLDLLPELRGLLERPAGRLSGGEQQMLALAQAVLDPPDFLVIDELSLGLAPVVVRRLVPTLAQIAASGVGVLLIEQFTSVALSLATTAGVLVRGRLRLLEDAATLRERPELVHHAYLTGRSV
jgi:branched-chain amino acid transport system ATP-binding protein